MSEKTYPCVVQVEYIDLGTKRHYFSEPINVPESFYQGWKIQGYVADVVVQLLSPDAAAQAAADQAAADAAAQAAADQATADAAAQAAADKAAADASAQAAADQAAADAAAQTSTSTPKGKKSS